MEAITLPCISSIWSFPALLAILSFPAAAQIIDVTWRTDLNGGEGEWNDAIHWDPAIVPNKTGPEVYHASVGGNAATTLTTDITIDRLNFTGGQILGKKVALTILDQLIIDLSGSAALTVETINLPPGASALWIGGSFAVDSSATANNFGNFTFVGSSPSSIDLLAGELRAKSAFVNGASGTFTVQSASQLTFNTGFDNAGLVVHASGTMLFQGSSAFQQTSGEYRLGLNATARGDLRFDGGTIRAEGTFDPDTALSVRDVNFFIGQSPNTIRSANFNNKRLSLHGGTLEFKIESGASYDTISNLDQWSANGTQLSLRLINGVENLLQPTDTLTLVNANSDTGVVFGNVASGERLTTVDGLGSFLVSYPAGSGDLILSDFQAVPEPRHVALSAGFILIALALTRRLRSSPPSSLRPELCPHGTSES